jgi:hypothetical protein
MMSTMKLNKSIVVYINGDHKSHLTHVWKGVTQMTNITKLSS